MASEAEWLIRFVSLGGLTLFLACLYMAVRTENDQLREEIRQLKAKEQPAIGESKNAK